MTGPETLDTAAQVEAILFVAEEPLTVEELAEVLEVPKQSVEEELDRLGERLDGHGIELRRVGRGWRIYTRPAAAPHLERFSRASATRLSAAALEVLAVVAYRQPVTRAQMTHIRGVDSESAVRTLERHGLIEEAGRLPLPGNPAVYRTTPTFLEKLGMRALDELPPLGGPCSPGRCGRSARGDLPLRGVNVDDGPDPPRLQEAPDPPRLQKVIAASGMTRAATPRSGYGAAGSRWMAATARLGDRADPETAAVTVDGVPLPVRPGLVTYLLNKPAGVVSTSADPQGRPTVVGLGPHRAQGVPGGEARRRLGGSAPAHERRRAGQPGHPSALRDHQDLQPDGGGPSRRGDAPAAWSKASN